MNDPPAVNILDPLDHLISQHEHGLGAELLSDLSEEVFEGRTEKVHDHDILVAFNPVVDDLGDGLGEDGRVRVEPEVDSALGVELLVFGVDFLEFDGVFLFGFEVDCFPDFSESSGAQLLYELVVFGDDHVLHGKYKWNGG